MDSSESEGEEQENTALRLAQGEGPADKSMDSSDTEGEEQERSGSKLGQGEGPFNKSLESLQTQEVALENKGSQSTQGEEPVDKPLESSETPSEGQDKSCSQSAQKEESSAGPEGVSNQEHRICYGVEEEVVYAFKCPILFRLLTHHIMLKSNQVLLMLQTQPEHILICHGNLESWRG